MQPQEGFLAVVRQPRGDEQREEVIGTAEIRTVFVATKIGTIGAVWEVS